ncbi:hypothetical protein K438DRAFT_1835944 [Mycena galopus ATCC 62051]|nr:hypothetical protein K438DRAFT_1835944 [Mycena galopus ATCC 62051]
MAGGVFGPTMRSLGIRTGGSFGFFFFFAGLGTLSAFFSRAAASCLAFAVLFLGAMKCRRRPPFILWTKSLYSDLRNRM